MQCVHEQVSNLVHAAIDALSFEYRGSATLGIRPIDHEYLLQQDQIRASRKIASLMAILGARHNHEESCLVPRQWYVYALKSPIGIHSRGYIECCGLIHPLPRHAHFLIYGSTALNESSASFDAPSSSDHQSRAICLQAVSSLNIQNSTKIPPLP